MANSKKAGSKSTKKGKGAGKEAARMAAKGAAKMAAQQKAPKKGGGATAGGEDSAAVIAAARKAAFTSEVPAVAFEHFKGVAGAVEAEGLSAFTGQALLLRANIMTALAAVEPHLPAAVSKLRNPALQEVFELPSLVMGLDFASQRVPVAKLSAGEIEQMLHEGAPWRDLMLRYLEVAAHPLIGLLPAERVAAVRKGHGKLDSARDFVALPGLFAEFGEVLSGRHPFPADKLDLLATLGGALVLQVKPRKAAAPVPKRTAEAILRDQFAALIVERYDQLEVLTAVALGKRKADALLPALRSTIAFGGAAPSDEAEAEAETDEPTAGAEATATTPA